MYNEEIKKRYIVENKARNRNLEAQATILFNRCEPYELKLKKDIAVFATTEIIGCLKSFNSMSLESLMVACSQYKLYVDWCIVNKILVTDFYNHFREIDNEILKQCLNSYLAETRVFTRDDVLKWTDELINPRDKFILLGLFEGIGATSKLAYEEFIDLKIQNFDKPSYTIELSPTHRIKYSPKLYEIAQEAAKADELVTYGKNGQPRYIKFETTDNIVKFAARVMTYNYKMLMNKTLVKIKQELNNPAINIQSLKESGRIDMIKRKMAEGKTLEEALSDPDVVNTYGRILSKKRYISNYFAE